MEGEEMERMGHQSRRTGGEVGQVVSVSPGHEWRGKVGPTGESEAATGPASEGADNGMKLRDATLGRDLVVQTRFVLLLAADESGRNGTLGTARSPPCPPCARVCGGTKDHL